MSKFTPPLPGKYRHYKGRLYTFMCLGKSTEDDTWQVIYSDADMKIWVRPYEEFVGSAMQGEQLVKRFTWQGN